MNVAEFLTVFGIGVGLSMDAFAVAITQGACLDIRTPKYPLAIGVTFGLFQAAMPLIGWIAGYSFKGIIARLDHWIALVLLSAVGIKMFVDGLSEFRKKRRYKDQGLACPVSPGGRLRLHDAIMMGLATSIDALAVGITFGMLEINIWLSILIIGSITFVLSTSGVFIGKRAGIMLGDGMQMAGGIVLTSLGLKIVVEHLIRSI
jgi:putative Mn2+ efflux pump MntP